MTTADSLAECIQNAQHLFDVLGVPALMLSYDTELHHFELWNYLDPPQVADFWIREHRIPLCKITPNDLRHQLSYDEVALYAMAWAAFALSALNPPLLRGYNLPIHSLLVDTSNTGQSDVT